MPQLQSPDGTHLFYEETGTGVPILFIHEFGGDHRAWEPQVRKFARRFRCITYAARGYEPSGVPSDPAAYSQENAVADALAILDGLGIERAHAVGLSMGGNTSLYLAAEHPERIRSAVVSGVGLGSDPELGEAWKAEHEKVADLYEREGAEAVAPLFEHSPIHHQFARKDPRGHAEWRAHFAEHDGLGAALTIRGVQLARPSLYDTEALLREISVPVLVIVGDEDRACIDPCVWLKRTIPTAGLAVIPASGHTVNLEEPESYNSLLAEFFARAEAGTWPYPELPAAVAAPD